MQEVNDGGGYFSVSADEVCDVSNKEQLVITVRYVNKDDEICEKFLGFADVSSDTTGERLAEDIKTFLQSKGFDLLKLRSQCYDGAGNMAGKTKGQCYIFFMLTLKLFLFVSTLSHIFAFT